jgi:hypothetical protein
MEFLDFPSMNTALKRDKAFNMGYINLAFLNRARISAQINGEEQEQQVAGRDPGENRAVRDFCGQAPETGLSC